MPNMEPSDDRKSPSRSSSGAPSTWAPETARPKRGTGKVILVIAVILGLIFGGIWFQQRSAAKKSGAGGPMGRGGAAAGPVPVVAGVVSNKNVPIYLDGLGTVQALNTVTIRARVDGQIQKIAFVEGQDVHEGDLLAQIDPAPFQTQVDQNVAKQAQDQAQLAAAQVTLQRDAALLKDKIVSQQDYDTQKAVVDQLAAAVQADQAAINNAKVQLGYTTITSPLDGRTGIRQVDQGNIIHANDSNGFVVITQLRPISAIFTLPEQNLRSIQEQLGAGHELTVLAVDRDNRTTLDEGKLTVVDNQIDTSTGTIRIKAAFPNAVFHLWPGQFINARLLVTVRTNGLVVPASVVQRGPDGPYAFVIKSDQSVEARAIQVGHTDQGEALIDVGLHAGEQVVVDGQYKLRPGAHVKMSATNQPSSTIRAEGIRPSGGGNGSY